MSYYESQESDSQGFIPNQMIIKSKFTSDFKDQIKIAQFQPKYLTGETVIKKQFSQSFHIPNNINRQKRQNLIGNNIEYKKQELSASRLYLNENYQCVYSRFKKPFGQGMKAAFSNDIIIKNINQPQNFRILKNQKSDYILKQQQNNKLKFDSKFEGGNLLCVFKSNQQINTYILFMQNDTNTYGYNQWFYFSIRQIKSKQKYTFKIVNFVYYYIIQKKKYSFFKYGMQLYIYSQQENKINGYGWYMDGYNFQYYKSNIYQTSSDSYYTLSFQIEFKYDHDFILICPSLPYSYSKLIYQLNKYQQIALNNKLSFQFYPISRTLGGNQVPYLKISKKNEIIHKKSIIITARQHSGETWSSHLMDQLIKGLSYQNDSYYQWIISNYDFHIFPMINVDGVIYGNFRCDLGGYDLNRCWKNTSSLLQPHINKIKQIIYKINNISKIDFFLDLHTHSKQHGVFAYCCVDSNDCKKIPSILSSITQLFRYPACTFGITKDKKQTARSQIFELTKNINTITIQLSTFGYLNPISKKLQPFNLNNIKAISQALINSIYYHQNTIQPIIKIQSYINNQQYPQGVGYFDKQDGEVSGSDSQPDADQISQNIKIKKILKQLRFHHDLKIKKTKTRLKKLKTNININNSTQINQVQSKYLSPINRHRALTQTQNKKELLKTEGADSKKIIKEQIQFNSIESFKKIKKDSRRVTSYLQDSLHTDISSLKMQGIKGSRPLNLIQFSLKKLPIFPNEKIGQSYPINIPQPPQPPENNLISSISLSKKIVDTQKLVKNKIITYYRTKKQSKIQNNINNKQPYQFLCVMSQSKKKQQFMKIKERKQQQDSRLVNRRKFNQIKQSTVLSRYLNDKKAQNSYILSKIWINNFNRYSKSLEESND